MGGILGSTQILTYGSVIPGKHTDRGVEKGYDYMTFNEQPLKGISSEIVAQDIKSFASYSKDHAFKIAVYKPGPVDPGSEGDYPDLESKRKNGKTITIRTQSGTSLTLTHDHKLTVFDGSEVKEIPAESVTTSHYVFNYKKGSGIDKLNKSPANYGKNFCNPLGLFGFDIEDNYVLNCNLEITNYHIPTKVRVEYVCLNESFKLAFYYAPEIKDGGFLIDEENLTFKSTPNPDDENKLAKKYQVKDQPKTQEILIKNPDKFTKDELKLVNDKVFDMLIENKQNLEGVNNKQYEEMLKEREDELIDNFKYYSPDIPKTASLLGKIEKLKKELQPTTDEIKNEYDSDIKETITKMASWRLFLAYTAAKQHGYTLVAFNIGDFNINKLLSKFATKLNSLDKIASVDKGSEEGMYYRLEFGENNHFFANGIWIQNK